MEPSAFLPGCFKFNLESQKDFFETYYKSMYSLCLRYSKDETQAASLLNLCFTQALKNIKQYNSKKQTLDSWVKAYFIKEIIGVLKQDKTGWLRVGTISSKGDQASVNTGSAVEYMTEGNLIPSLHLLPSAYRVIYNLFVLDGYTIDQICELLDASALTVETNLGKARYELKRNLLKLNGHGISLH
jgi:RNA polymerase sigma-70 factor (ECF subfamily)